MQKKIEEGHVEKSQFLIDLMWNTICIIDLKKNSIKQNENHDCLYCRVAAKLYDFL
jgi:hypothetical protein